jgi:hypothetical protein
VSRPSTKLRALIVLTLLGIADAMLPAIAGAFKMGEREGPSIFAESYHSVVFRLGYSLAGHGKPRSSPDRMLQHRPHFYGLRPRIIS